MHKRCFDAENATGKYLMVGSIQAGIGFEQQSGNSQVAPIHGFVQRTPVMGLMMGTT